MCVVGKIFRIQSLADMDDYDDDDDEMNPK